MDNNQVQQSDEITIKELIFKVREFIVEAFKNWLLIGIVGVLFVSLMVVKSLTATVKYKAPITFTLTEESASAGGLMSVAAQFGFGGLGGGSFNQEKIITLISSQKILHNTLFKKVKIDNREDYIANFFIEIYELEEVFEESKKITDFTRFDNADLGTLSESMAFKIIHKKITEEMLSKGYELETGIMSFAVTSKSEDLAYEMTNAIFRELDDFYTKKAVEPQQRTFDILVHRADSIWNAMRDAEYRTAKLNDTDNGFFFATESELPKQRAVRDVQMYGAMYQEVAKNLEFARFSLENSTPILQTIDLPMHPLEDDKGSLLVAIIIGGFLGGLFGVGFVVIRKIYRDVMKDDD